MPSKREEYLQVTETTENFITWSEREYIPEDIKKSSVNSNVLIIPNEGFRDRNEPLFPVGTESLWHYLKENSSEDLNVEICIADEDYNELALHGALIIVGGFVVTSIVAPVVVNLLSDYIKSKWSSKIEKPDTKINVELTVVENDGSSKKLTYEGPANQFGKTLNQTLSKGNNSTDQLNE